jgi:hypothetical protein
MPNETTASNTTSGSAWQQSSSANTNNTSTDTSPDTALLPVKIKYLFDSIEIIYSFLFIA